MAIRIRVVGGQMIALCAARSVPKAGDIYLNDAVHGALSAKFARDFNEMFEVGLPHNEAHAALVEAEESNNPNREAWDKWMNEGLTAAAGRESTLSVSAIV